MSGLFMYAARPPEVAKSKYSDLRYFGSDRENNTNNCLQIRTTLSRASVQVLRFADQSEARLAIAVGGGMGASADVTLDLTANQLQTLACALLDAAHDLRTVPATSDEEVAT